MQENESDELDDAVLEEIHAEIESLSGSMGKLSDEDQWASLGNTNLLLSWLRRHAAARDRGWSGT